MIQADAGGVVADVWVVAGASRDEVVGTHGGALRVRTAQPRQGGRANAAVVVLVADVLGAPSARVVAGHRGRRKRLLVEGVSIESARRRLVEAGISPRRADAGNE